MQPVTRDVTLRRVRVLNGDGDVYVESGGTDAEIVLKTQKVRGGRRRVLRDVKRRIIGAHRRFACDG